MDQYSLDLSRPLRAHAEHQGVRAEINNQNCTALTIAGLDLLMGNGRPKRLKRNRLRNAKEESETIVNYRKKLINYLQRH